MRVLSLVAILAGIAGLSAGGALAEPVRVALLPIAVHSAGSDTAYLSHGLADMLTARLEQSGGVVVVPVSPEGEGSGDPLTDAVAAGRAAEADYALFGSFTQFGSGASLDMRCMPLQGDEGAMLRRVFVQSGTLGEIIPKLGEVAGRIVRYVGVESTEGGEPAAAVTAGNGALEILRQRVEDLERAVFIEEPAPAPAAEPTAASEAPALASEVR